ncbi:MAG: polyhydroxyalkanoate depolymerase, partial [Pseudomonadota bacterium]
MLYSLVELNRAAMAPLRLTAQSSRAFLNTPLNPMKDSEIGRSMRAAADVFESATRYYGKPNWNLDITEINGLPVPVDPEIVWQSPWCRLLHFKRDPELLGQAIGHHTQPRLLIVAPLSGHYATLLRGTVEAFLPSHEVFITDWSDARMAPVWLGRFDLDDYIDHVRQMLTALGPGANVLAVCQPGPPALAAISLMAEDEDPNLPATMTFMGSPIDARKSPT